MIIGSTISHYKILGVVYRAEGAKLEHPAALKFLTMKGALGAAPAHLPVVCEEYMDLAVDSTQLPTFDFPGGCRYQESGLIAPGLVSRKPSIRAPPIIGRGAGI